MFLVLKSLTQSPLFTFNAQLGGKKKKKTILENTLNEVIVKRRFKAKSLSIIQTYWNDVKFLNTENTSPALSIVEVKVNMILTDILF